MNNESLNSSNAIWDDGEWISWDEINRHLEDLAPSSAVDDDNRYANGRSANGNPTTVQEKLEQLEALVSKAHRLIDCGCRDEVDFGEMGEFYAEIRYGMKRHRPYAEGSDGKLGNDFIEVKTITPWKSKPKVAVRRSGHFNKLVVVKIDENLMFDARMISRAQLKKGNGGKMAHVSWTSMPKQNAQRESSRNRHASNHD